MLDIIDEKEKVEESLKITFWLREKKFLQYGQKIELWYYKPESQNYVLIRDIIYHYKARDDAPKIIQDLEMLSPLFLCSNLYQRGWNERAPV